jgi:transcriptional regulator with XRE-family HTH domain
MAYNLHIGNMIKNYIDQKNLVRSDVARTLNTPNTAIYAYEKRDSLKTSTILRLCYALKYNFFMDIANSLPRDFEQSATLSSDKDNLIKQQATEINKLQLENNLLKELIVTRQSR